MIRRVIVPSTLQSLASGTRGRARLIIMLPPLVAMSLCVFIGSDTLDALALAASGVRVALGCLALRQLDLDHGDLTLDPPQQYAMALCIALGFSVASGGLEEFGDEIIPSFDRFERLYGRV